MVPEYGPEGPYIKHNYEYGNLKIVLHRRIVDTTGIEPVHYKQLVQECTIMPDQLT